MSSLNLSRRAILAGASAVPIIALAPAANAFPAGAADIAAASPPIDDPIFAAIEAHREPNARYKEASVELSNTVGDRETARILLCWVDDKKCKITRRKGGGEIVSFVPTAKKKPIYVSTVHDIKTGVPRSLKGAPKRTAWIRKQVRKLRKEERRVAIRHAQTKLGKLELIQEQSYELERTRMWDLIWTKPTTLNGLSALLRYSRENYAIRELVHNDEWEEVLEWTIESAVCALAGLAEPPMSDVVASVWKEKEAGAIEALTA
jgi:hypothetical protein